MESLDGQIDGAPVTATRRQFDHTEDEWDLDVGDCEPYRARVLEGKGFNEATQEFDYDYDEGIPP